MGSTPLTLATRAIGAAALGLVLALAVVRLWSFTGAGSFLGGDLVAYLAAANRLQHTGSPYHPLLLAGPIENVVSNIPIAYYYPPPLAQLFTPLAHLSSLDLAFPWILTQVVLLALVLPLVWFSSSLDRTNGWPIWVALLGVSSFPLQFALYGGNVSGWMTIAVAVILAKRGGGAAIAASTLIKLTPGPLFAAGLVDARLRRRILAATGFMGVGSVLASPQAWLDWIRILPNLARLTPYTGYPNLSLTSLLGPAGFAQLGTALGYCLAVVFGAAALLAAARSGLGVGAVALALTSMLFLSTTIWDHYLAVFVPVYIAAWANAGTATRVTIAAAVVSQVLPWFFLDPFAVALALLVTMVAASAAIGLTALRRPRPADLMSSTGTGGTSFA